MMRIALVMAIFVFFAFCSASEIGDICKAQQERGVKDSLSTLFQRKDYSASRVEFITQQTGAVWEDFRNFCETYYTRAGNTNIPVDIVLRQFIALYLGMGGDTNMFARIQDTPPE